MATTVVKQFVATINSGATVWWDMTGVNPPFNRRLRDSAEPKWIVSWQAVPLVVTVDDVAANVNSKSGLIVNTVYVIQEPDTSLTHRVQIACVDANSLFAPAPFVTTYALYAVFHDV